MRGVQEEQTEHAAWVNEEKRIVTFQELRGYEKLTFRTQDEKNMYVYRLCESGYRIL